MIDRIRGWSPRKRWLVGLGGLAFLAGAGVAIAMFVTRAPIQGGGNVAQVNPTFTINATQIDASNNADCQATQPNTVQMNNVSPGGWCDVRFTVDNTGGNVAIKVQDIEFADLTTDTFRAPTVCGEVVTAGTTHQVFARFMVPNGTPPGPFSASLVAGITAADNDSWSLAQCP
jgi:hypothetical protein